jgi:hypothetical protein
MPEIAWAVWSAPAQHQDGQTSDDISCTDNPFVPAPREEARHGA